jgi:chromosome segregation ATPase
MSTGTPKAAGDEAAVADGAAGTTPEKTTATITDGEEDGSDKALTTSSDDPVAPEVTDTSHNNEEPQEDPERQKLEVQVSDRDASLSALEKARKEKQQELAALEKELEEERLNQMKEALIHKIESERLKRQTQHAEERLKALEHDMQDKAAIHEYANLIKSVAPQSGADSQYVVKLQNQLQKAVKKMETTMEHMTELEEAGKEQVTALSAEIEKLVEDRCRTELELRKQMEVLMEQKRDMQNDYEQRIRDNLKTLKALRAKATSQITIDELEEELMETEHRLEELNRIHKTQEETIQALNKSLAQEGGL